MASMELYQLPEKIKTLRHQMGFTQAELARRLGLTRASVNGWEMGLVVPSTSMLVELSKLFSVSADYLLGITQDSAISVEGLTPKEVAILVELAKRFQNQKN